MSQYVEERVSSLSHDVSEMRETMYRLVDEVADLKRQVSNLEDQVEAIPGRQVDFRFDVC